VLFLSFVRMNSFPREVTFMHEVERDENVIFPQTMGLLVNRHL
jgi:hypothetical protein